jgi:hypothetical protein
MTKGSVLHFSPLYKRGKCSVVGRLQFLRNVENRSEKRTMEKTTLSAGWLLRSYTFPKL